MPLTLTPLATLEDTPTSALDAVTDLAFAPLATPGGMKEYIFTISGLSDGVGAFEVRPNGRIVSKDQVLPTADLAIEGGRAIAATQLDNGKSYVYAADGFNGLTGFRVKKNGDLAALDTVRQTLDARDLNVAGIEAMEIVEGEGGRQFLIAAAASNDGLSVFRIKDNGTLKNVFNIDDSADLFLDGVNSLSVSGGIVAASSPFEPGLALFELNGRSGALTPILAPAPGLAAGNLSLVETSVRVVFVAIERPGAETIFVGYGLSASGELRAGVVDFDNGSIEIVQTLEDDGTLFFGDTADIALKLMEADGELFVVASSFQGTSVFEIDPATGQLAPAASIPADGLTPIRGGTSIIVRDEDGNTKLILGGNVDDGLLSFKVEVTEETPEIDGTRRNDRLEGSDLPEIFNGFKGRDTIETGDGSDLVRANQGDDRVIGAGGDDTVFGGDGRDRIDGGRGNDFLRGDDGNDILLGEGGNDNLDGGSGDDILNGGNGDDRLADGPGADRMSGGLGADVFVMVPDDDLDVIVEFEPFFDRIDLSAYGTVTSVRDLRFEVVVFEGARALKVFIPDGDGAPDELIVLGRTDPSELTFDF